GSHRRFSTAAENSKWNDNTRGGRCADRTVTSGRLKLQDKSGSPVEHQAIDMAYVQPCRSVELSAAIELFVSKVKGDFGTDRSLANSGEELG
ncbi:hypothetical protein, partial [Bradyrhizobium sp. SZCCHNRI1073]|uniref:hypothetical protein n=1 Tax=Bradyrhizobium sp. SZCCHNRI1073 TaxID=3057280 RepID=UPI0029167394